MFLPEINSCFNRFLAGCRYPTYSSFRNIWNNFTKNKEAAAEQQQPPETNETPAAGGAATNAQVNDLRKAIEELKQGKDELNVIDIALIKCLRICLNTANQSLIFIFRINICAL